MRPNPALNVFCYWRAPAPIFFLRQSLAKRTKEAKEEEAAKKKAEEEAAKKAAEEEATRMKEEVAVGKFLETDERKALEEQWLMGRGLRQKFQR